MESLSSTVTRKKRDGFWRRQFNADPTGRQIIFDVIFGILMPLLCFYFDPGILSRESLGITRGPIPVFSGRTFFIYAFSALAILALIVWMGLHNRATPSVRAGLGGVLLAGAVLSFAIGVVILPLTILGILFVIGILGLIPFFTGFVYLRNGVRASGIASPEAYRTPRVAIAVVVALIALGLPGIAQWKINSSVKESLAQILDPNTESIDAPLARIKRFHSFVDTDRILHQYESETNPARQERLGRAYKEITGEDIETRLTILRD
jgi:hypothetical protein